MLVSQILKSKASVSVVTVPGATTIADAAAVLSENGIGTVMVSEDGATPEGILSERDIVRQLVKVGYDCMTHPVSEYMTRDVVYCGLESRAKEVSQKMTEGRFRHMPVLEDGKLVGLVSLGDVVKAQLSQLAMEKQALEGMIMGH